MQQTIAIALGLVLAVACITDLRSRRIPNVLTVSAAAGFIAYHCGMGGWDGLLFSLAGLGTGLGVMLVPYALGVMGAGDVKLMAAVGAALGTMGVLWAFLLASLAGGVYAVGVLVVLVARKGGLGNTLANLRFAVLELVSTRRVSLPREPGGRLPRLCYGLAIAAGSAAYMIMNAAGVGLFAA